MKPGDPTPWGAAETVTFVGRVSRLGATGTVPAAERTIVFVSTASHGGYYVPTAILGRIPAAKQESAARWSRSVNWYEEDCEALSVAEAFPEFFGGAR